jgi:prepilin-type N-terminal cleavage/methylation domain-containing protein
MRKYRTMKKVRPINKVRKALRGSSRGLTLIEVLIALALFGIISITFAGGLGTASKAVLTADVRTSAESWASTQMESVKSQFYIDYSNPDRDPENYDAIEPEGYEIEVVAEPIDPDTHQPYPYDETEGAFEQDDGIQEITVLVRHDDRTVITLVGYKVFR